MCPLCLPRVFFGTAQLPPMVQWVNDRISVTFIGGNFGDSIREMPALLRV
jgi:hypothetical protein